MPMIACLSELQYKFLNHIRNHSNYIFDIVMSLDNFGL